MKLRIVIAVADGPDAGEVLEVDEVEVDATRPSEVEAVAIAVSLTQSARKILLARAGLRDQAERGVR